MKLVKNNQPTSTVTGNIVTNITIGDTVEHVCPQNKTAPCQDVVTAMREDLLCGKILGWVKVSSCSKV